MRPLVLIKSCHRHGLRRGAVRATWLPSLEWDYHFVMGTPPPGTGRWVNEPNVLHFEAPDDFKNIAPKLQQGFRWGLENGYDLFFVCDDDTYVVVPNLVNAVLEFHWDYQGWVRPNGGVPYPLPYIQASGMLLSKRAAEFVATSNEMVNGVPEYVTVGRALCGKVPFTHDSRFDPGPVAHLFPYTVSTHKCLPETMHLIHREFVCMRTLL